VLAKLSGLCLAILVLASTLTAGWSYLWCAMMQERVDTCCCAPEHGTVDTPRDQGPELRNGCCEHRGLDELTKGSVVSSTIEVPPALPVAVIPQVVTLAAAIPAAPLAPDAGPSTVRERPIRAGPHGATDTCVWLQVFRC
jgi:hypothetical protein